MSEMLFEDSAYFVCFCIQFVVITSEHIHSKADFQNIPTYTCYGLGAIDRCWSSTCFFSDYKLLYWSQNYVSWQWYRSAGSRNNDKMSLYSRLCYCVFAWQPLSPGNLLSILFFVIVFSLSLFLVNCQLNVSFALQTKSLETVECWANLHQTCKFQVIGTWMMYHRNFENSMIAR